MIPDSDHWTVRAEREVSTAVFVVSDKTHVWLRITGDFADYDEKLAYARDIARRLNETTP